MSWVTLKLGAGKLMVPATFDTLPSFLGKEANYDND